MNMRTTTRALLTLAFAISGAWLGCGDGRPPAPMTQVEPVLAPNDGGLGFPSPQCTPDSTFGDVCFVGNDDWGRCDPHAFYNGEEVVGKPGDDVPLCCTGCLWAFGCDHVPGIAHGDSCCGDCSDDDDCTSDLCIMGSAGPTCAHFPQPDGYACLAHGETPGVCSKVCTPDGCVSRCD
jgi:hypothetical protein